MCVFDCLLPCFLLNICVIGVGWGGFFTTALILFTTSSLSTASIVVCLCEIELFVILKKLHMSNFA